MQQSNIRSLPYKGGEKDYALLPRVWDPTTLINFLQVLLPVSHNKYILQCLCRTKFFYHCSKDVMLVSHQPYRFTFSSSLIICYGFCFQVFNTEALIQYLGYSWNWVNPVLTLFPFKSSQVNALQASQSLKQLGWDGWNPIRFGLLLLSEEQALSAVVVTTIIIKVRQKYSC